MRLPFSLLLSLFIFISLGSSPAQTNLIKKPIVWDSKNKLPLLKGKSQQIGLAGALIGVSNDRLIIAGGANFPTGMPWEGGKKVLNKDIYIATLVNGTTLEWESKNIQLPEPIAYSANVNFENGFISIGGEKNQGPVNHVSYWIWDEKNGNLIENRLPNLQSPLTNSAAIIFNHHLYVIGGENVDGPTAAVWFLDLVRREKGWQRGPSLPLPTTHATAVVQADGEGTQLFLIGGRAKQSSGISELYNQVLKLGVKENQWSSKSPITLGQIPIPAISAASGIASGSANILMFGGDDGQIFHQIETLDKKIKEAESEQEKSYLTSLKKQLVENHPGFNKAVLLYNTITDTWTRLNDLPYSPVTTTVLHWKGHVIIPSGEIHPGIRTPKILIGSCETTSPQPQPTSKVQMAPFSQQQQVRVTSIGNSVIYSAGIPDREDNAHISQLQPLLGENYTIKNFVRNEPSTFADLINLSGLPASTFNLKIQ